MDRGLDEGITQTGIHTEFTEAVRAEHSARVDDVEQNIAMWQTSDTSKIVDAQCPYYAARQGVHYVSFA